MNGHETVEQITRLQQETVECWHHEPFANPYEGLPGVVCQQHHFNYLLWHEEDIARSPNEPDTRIADVKRTIDEYNQQRNDWIERIDEYLLRQIQDMHLDVADDAPQNTETPGSAMDRLSIMSLRIYHLNEQFARTDADDNHLAMVQANLDRCHEQLADLSGALAQLIDDIFAGRKRLKLYRQMKMYNDPGMNPYLYKNKS